MRRDKLDVLQHERGAFKERLNVVGRKEPEVSAVEQSRLGVLEVASEHRRDDAIVSNVRQRQDDVPAIVQQPHGTLQGGVRIDEVLKDIGEDDNVVAIRRSELPGPRGVVEIEAQGRLGVSRCEPQRVLVLIHDGDVAAALRQPSGDDSGTASEVDDPPVIPHQSHDPAHRAFRLDESV